MSTSRRLTHVDDPRAVGARLREARERAGLSQRQLAFEGCTAAYISRIEAGDRTPSYQLIRALAERLGVTAEYLATGVDHLVSGGRRTETLLEAEIALRLDDTERARELFQAAVDEASTDRERADALTGLGQLAFREGDPSLTKHFLEEALGLHGDDITDHPKLAETLGRAYVALGESESALEIFERCLAAADESDDFIEAIRFSVPLANTLIDANNFGRAQELLGHALARTAEMRDPLIRARLYWSQSRLHALQGAAETAARYGRRALALIELTEDTHAAACLHQLLAHVELDRDQPEEALSLLERGVELLGKEGNAPLQARFRLEEARALMRLNRFDEAAEVAMEAAGVLADTNPVEAGRGYYMVGEGFERLGDHSRAQELYELAVELLERRPNRYLAAAYLQLSELLDRDGKRDEAMELLKKAVRAQAEAGSVPRR